MLKKTAAIALAMFTLGGALPVHAHGNGHHHAERHYDERYRGYDHGHRYDRRSDRRYRRYDRKPRWVRQHEQFLYHGESFRHRHGRAGRHWHRAPRYRFHAAGHPCDALWRHRHGRVWYFGAREAHLVDALAYGLTGSYGRYHRDDDDYDDD